MVCNVIWLLRDLVALLGFLGSAVLNTPMWYAEPPTRSLGGYPIGEWDTVGGGGKLPP